MYVIKSYSIPNLEDGVVKIKKNTALAFTNSIFKKREDLTFKDI